MATGRLHITMRHYWALRGPLLAVALVTAALAGLLAAGPSIFARLADQEIGGSISGAGPSARYLIGHPSGRILAQPSRNPDTSDLGDLDPLYGGWQDQLAGLRAGLPEPLRSRVGAAEWTLSYQPSAVGPNPTGVPPSVQTSIATVLDPHPERVARLTDGQWPQGEFGELPLAVAVSREAAATLGVTVGSQLGDYRIAGIFEPIDPGADYWLLNPGLVRATVFDDGNSPITTAATAFISPQQAGLVPIPGGFSGAAPDILVWFPLDLSGMTPPTADRILAQLGGTVAAARPMPVEGRTVTADAQRGTVDEMTLSADAIDILAGALGRISAGSSVLLLALGGPLIAILAVLAATVLTLLRRGRAATGLFAVRGASRYRIRRYWLGAGLIAGLPAALFAAGVVRLLFGAQASGAGLGAGIAIGLLPAVLVAAAPIPDTGPEADRSPAFEAGRSTGSRGRPDQRRGRRWRPVAEFAVLLLAAASTYLLLAAGLDSAAGTGSPGGGARSSGAGTGTPAASGTDLFVIAAPLLLIAAAAVIVLRLYPIPLRAAARWARRRRGAVAFVGSLRALRDPIAGVIPVVAILAGISVAGLSGALLTTIDAGTRGAALAALGAPVRVTDPSSGGIDDERYARLIALDSVAAAARVGRVAVASLLVPGQASKPSAEVYLADLAALGRVQAGVPGAAPPARQSGAEPGDPATLEAVGSTALAPAGSLVQAGSRKILLTATTDRLVGITRARTFLLLDSSVTAWGPFRPHTVLLAPAAGADAQQLSLQVAEVLGPAATVTTAAGAAAALHDGPMATGMRLVLYGAMITAAVATIAALLLSVVTATARRIRLSAIVRILGFTRRQRRALIIWEQAPVALAALLGGAGLGVGLATLVHATIDLSPFTGGSAPPPLVIDWVAMAELFAGFLLAVVLAVGIGIVLTRRITAARAIAVDEE